MIIPQDSIPCKLWKFPAGEVGVQVDYCQSLQQSEIIRITCNFTGSDSILELMLKNDAIKRAYPHNPRSLVIPYFPYARQDRVMQRGESHSLRVIADLINSMDFKFVTVYDPHSTVVEALLNNLTVVNQLNCLIMSDQPDNVYIPDYDYFIAPDAGAYKKIWDIARYYEKPVVVANKTRDIRTGEVVGIFIQNEDFDKLKDKKVLVIDDICDGGRTFTELADSCLFQTKQADLYVTHGIFSKGKEPLLKYYKNVWCFNDMSQQTKGNV